MKHLPTYLFLFLFLTVAAKADDIATDLVTLRTFLADKSEDVAALHGVYMACLNLTRTGTEEAVPLLKQLLDDERFSTVARTALVNLPGDAGIKALRESLGTLQGKNLVGVIQTLGNVRDKESVDAIVKIVETAEDENLVKAAFRAFGNIAPKEAINALSNLVQQFDGDGNFFDDHKYPTWIYEIGINIAERLQQEGDLELAVMLYDDMGCMGTGIGYLNTVRLLEMLMEMGEDGVKTLCSGALIGWLTLLPQDTVRFDDYFKFLLRLVLELKNPDTGTIVLDNLGNLPVWQQAALVRNLGARKDSVAIVPRLMELLTQSEEQELRLAAIEALGEIGDPQVIDALLHLAGTPAEETADGRPQTAAEELAKAATDSLKLFSGEEFDKKIIDLLDHDNKTLRLAALDVIGARKMVAASEKLKTLIPDRDREIRQSVYTAYANAVAPTKENIEFLFRRLLASRQQFVRLPSEQMGPIEAELKTHREAILTLCRRTGDRDNVVDLFVGIQRPDLGEFFLDCLFQLGGEKAASAIAKMALGNDETLHDKATELLGQWTTPEVAPHLIDIAEKHPNERYRSRTLRGYLRVIRQMGLPVEQKVQMAEKALAVANAVNLADADKEQAAQVLEQVKGMFNTTRQ